MDEHMRLKSRILKTPIEASIEWSVRCLILFPMNKNFTLMSIFFRYGYQGYQKLTSNVSFFLVESVLSKPQEFVLMVGRTKTFI
jgi:hypothetical protein